MNVRRFESRGCLFGAILLAGCVMASLAAGDPAPGSEANLGIIRYKAPPGWQATDKPEQGARVLTSPDSTATAQAMILIILGPPKDDLDFRSTFDASVKQITGTGKLVESGEAISSKSRQGFDALSQTLVTETANGQHVHFRVIAAKVQNRMAELVYLSNDDALYQKCQADVNAMLGSISFDVKAASAAAADTAALLEDAKKRFAREADARRKPHVVLGDVLTLDGKPIPNVAGCTVEVGGTTIAAERAHYSLDVDAKGHFEQQIPDGLYYVYAKCIATVGGHRVALDLVPLDGHKLSISQASATGIVADFRMVMDGLKPEQNEKDPRSFCGGLLNVSGPPYTLTTGSFGDRHPNAHVRFTFVSKSAAADGSQYGTFSRDISAADANYTAYLKSLPIAVYSVSAKLIEADGTTRPLWCSRTVNAQQFTESVEIFWETTDDVLAPREPVLLFLKE